MGLAIHYLGIQPFIVTLAGLFLFRGLAFVLSTNSVSIQNDFLTGIAQTRIPILGYRLSAGAALALAAVVVAALVLRYTRFGRNVYAVGGNEQSALLMGLPLARTKIAAYTLSGFCSALAGLAYLFYTQSGDAAIGVGLELDAIAVVVIGGTLLTGGTGNVLGTLLGVLVLGLVKTIISFEGTLSSWWTKIFVGSLLLAFILLQRFIRFRFRAPGEVV
jgi:simple sugar transport system permease protein